MCNKSINTTQAECFGMRGQDERLLCAIIIAGCVFASASISTEANFVSNETRQSRQRTKNEGETYLADYVVRYENVTFTVDTRHDKNETEYDIHFVAFNRTFTLVLHERACDNFSFRHPVASKVTVKIASLAKSHSGDSRCRKTGGYVNRDLDHYVRGYLRNEPTSVFHGQYRYCTGILDGVIGVAGETYYVRTPLNQRRNDTAKETFPLLIYRERDVKLHSPKEAVTSQQTRNSFVNVNLKGVTPPNSEHSTTEARQHTMLFQKAGFKRQRRQTSPVYKVCELTIVVHYSFYSIPCEGSITKTIDEVGLAVWRADSNFRRGDFNSDGVADNIGFVIKELIIYTDELSQDYRLDNYEYSKDTLRAFSKFDFSDSCLAALFTHQTYEQNVVGLAYMGLSSRFAAPGGLCEERTRIQKAWRSLNTMFVSSLDAAGQIPWESFSLTLIHELGHSFGAPHDNDTECMPGGIYGMYIMHPYDVQSIKVHSKMFSPCSVLIMGPVIDSKGSCLKLYEANNYCGNSIREAGEECDCGLDPEYCRSIDMCCVPPSLGEPGCRIQREDGHVCSPLASPCCTDSCQVETETRVCRAATECARAARCDAVDVACPESVSLADGTLCAGGVRVCSGGECVGSRCELHGWADCQCVGVPYELCQLCCAAKNTSGFSCMPAHRCSDTDDIAAPIFLNFRDTCGGTRGFCNRKQECIAAYPKDDENILGHIVKGSSDKLYHLLRDYWYLIMLAVGILVVFASLVGLYCKEITMSTMGYKSGKIASAWLVLSRQHSSFSDQLRELESQYREKLYELENDHVLDLLIGTARLSVAFPTVKRDKIAMAIKRSNCEEFAVRRLLLVGYPMRKNLFSKSFVISTT